MRGAQRVFPSQALGHRPREVMSAPLFRLRLQKHSQSKTKVLVDHSRGFVGFPQLHSFDCAIASFVSVVNQALTLGGRKFRLPYAAAQLFLRSPRYQTWNRGRFLSLRSFVDAFSHFLPFSIPAEGEGLHLVIRATVRNVKTSQEFLAAVSDSHLAPIAIRLHPILDSKTVRRINAVWGLAHLVTLGESRFLNTHVLHALPVLTVGDHGNELVVSYFDPWPRDLLRKTPQPIRQLPVGEFLQGMLNWDIREFPGRTGTRARHDYETSVLRMYHEIAQPGDLVTFEMS